MSDTKTLAVRVPTDLHTQLTLLAQLRDSSITEEIRTALESHIEAARSSDDLTGRAEDILDAIEREATTRREAISELFGDSTPKGKPATRARKSTGGRTPAAES